MSILTAVIDLGRRLRSNSLDLSIVSAITVFSAFLSGSRQFTGFNSPDSEFYASMAIFGNDVTERAVEPAYYWTRLGYIAPLRLLVTVFGPWPAFAIWRLVLILILVASLYWLIRQVSSRWLATTVALFASLNTVILSFAGNTYLTGTILTATTLFLTLATWCAFGTPRYSWLPGALSGAVAAWLVMLNPYALFLGISMWFAVRLVGLLRATTNRWRKVMIDGLSGLVGFLVVMMAFLGSGLLIFPGGNWLGTYVSWNGNLDYESFISDPMIWTQDIAFLVPLIALCLSLMALVTTRANTWAITAFAIATANIAFTAIYFLLVPGPWLEAPHYLAKLWPGALAAIGLSFAALVGKRPLPPAALLGLVVACPLVMWAGRWENQITIGWALVLTFIICLAFLGFALCLRVENGLLLGVLLLIALTIAASGLQLLQNGRGWIGIYSQYPFRAAYVDFSAQDIMQEKINAERWILSQTTTDDSIGIWVDPGRLMSGVAAMQFWGMYNNLPSGASLAPADLAALEKMRPTTIAMYAPTHQEIIQFWTSIPGRLAPSAPDCITVVIPGIGVERASVCVTHLHWPS